MPTYSFNCSSHGEFNENCPWEEYKAKDDKWECPECGEPCKRVWAGKAPMVRIGNPETHAVKRSYNYIQGSEENWMRDEVRNIKDNVLSQEGQSKSSPYSTFQVSDPEALGFKKVDEGEARQRMEAAKKSKKDALVKKDNQSKR